jgi:RHH-type transcriptional regulator, proline utilization regulon repressor / proline dehydrogenase / delta 1-pyrroline-5-carboxylate dehydrogenase
MIDIVLINTIFMKTDNKELTDKIINRGKEIFSLISGDKPSIFNKAAWMGKVMDWSMRNENFKVQIFRFVDVFPALTNNKLLTEHIHEYFGEEKDMPSVLSWGAKVSGMLGSVGGAVLNKLISSNIHEMACQFIIGETTREALKNITKLRENNFSTVVDVLGEATLSEEEAETYINTYLELLSHMDSDQKSWKTLGKDNNELDWGSAPKINVAVKPSALFCLANPMDFEGSVIAILNRMRRIFTKVMQVGGFLCIDMESYRYKDITIEVFKRLKLEFPDYHWLGIVLQAYLRDTGDDLDHLINWAKENNLQISIRLVKGAYWDYETVKAEQNGWPVPVWTVKAESDAAYERHARKILENHSNCHFACASHNIRTISAVLEMARELDVPESRYEFQVLYGMAEPVRNSILKVTGRVRLYCPYGDLVPGMGYLVRRLLENTANESFLRQSFNEEADLERLLEDPVITIKKSKENFKENKMETKVSKGLVPFVNEPMADFTRKDVRDSPPLPHDQCH